MKKDKKTIKELIIEFIYLFESSSALTGKLPLQHIAWEFIEDCNAVLLCLITDKILKDNSIERIIKAFDECANVVCEYIGSKEQIQLAMYWMLILNDMKKRCLEEEQFEACSNIKKFSDLYFIITPKDIDD